LDRTVIPNRFPVIDINKAITVEEVGIATEGWKLTLCQQGMLISSLHRTINPYLNLLYNSLIIKSID